MLLFILTHTHLTALFPGLPGWASTRKVKPIWISLKQEAVSGSGISWTICKSAPRSRQITMPVPHHSVILQAGCPSCRPTNSIKALKHFHKRNFLLLLLKYYVAMLWTCVELSYVLCTYHSIYAALESLANLWSSLDVVYHSCRSLTERPLLIWVQSTGRLLDIFPLMNSAWITCGRQVRYREDWFNNWVIHIIKTSVW